MKITFLPNNIIWEGAPGGSLMQIAAEAGVFINGDCGWACTCKKCTVFIDGKPVLACETRPDMDLNVVVPEVHGAIPTEACSGNAKDVLDMGVAFDLGTTTVVGSLWDLKTGKQLGSLAETNPQRIYGADVISRIAYGMQDAENLGRLRDAIIRCVDEITGRLIFQAGGDPTRLREMVFAGNTAMAHFFAGKDPAKLAVSPFASAFTGALSGSAEDLGIRPTAKYYLMPGIGGHVGSDITADILATGMHKSRGTELLIDIGTNGEIVLLSGRRMMACSAAAGPAFEGAGVRQGMRAVEGAISEVTIRDGTAEVKVIGGGRPMGICGTGIIDAVAAMLSAGILNKTGRMGVPEFVLSPGATKGDIAICQKDIREVQLAKAAIAAGIQLLMKEMDVAPSDLTKIHIVGAFGSLVKIKSARAIGLIPWAPNAEILCEGNAAGIGASMALLSSKARKQADRIAGATTHFELAECSGFQNAFLENMELGRQI